MGDLSIRVTFHDEVVEDRVLPVSSAVVVGDWPGARVSFPGAAVQVSRVGRMLRVRGRILDEGAHLDFSLGPVSVRLENTRRMRAPTRWGETLDLRFLATAIVVVAVGSWVDAAEVWADRLPSAVMQPGQALVKHVVDSIRIPAIGGRSAATASHRRSRIPVRSRPQVAEGPEHQSDDHVTGIGFHPWYRRSMPTDPLAFDANDALLLDPEDAGARRVLARAAYNTEHFSTAAWHYRWLVDRYPADASARLRLAWAERRQGHHRAEIDLYRDLLEVRSGHQLALGGLASALARLGRFGEAMTVLDELQVRAPAAPYTDVTTATVAALQGEERLALDALRRAVGARDQLNPELQIELRRDLALDPAFAPLRRDRRLRALLRRHLGAAAPRPAR